MRMKPHPNPYTPARSLVRDYIVDCVVDMASCNVTTTCRTSGILRNFSFSEYKDCPQFCSDFENVRHVYLSFSVLSSLGCLLVFLTYALLPRLRHGGYSSRVFIYRYARSLVQAALIPVVQYERFIGLFQLIRIHPHRRALVMSGGTFLQHFN